jgi:putative DNA methylase
VLVSATGKARLRRGPEYPADWDPTKDDRIPVWEALHQLVRAFRTSGEHGAAKLAGAAGGALGGDPSVGISSLHAV